jgi:transmembrane sensor
MSTPEAAAETDAVRENATRWLARLARGLDKDDGVALREWLKDATNREAILSAGRLWEGADISALLSELFPTAANTESVKPGRDVFAASLAAAVAVAIVVSFAVALDGKTPLLYFLGHPEPKSSITTNTYTTGIGMMQDVRLLDGSTLTLNTDTRVTVVYSPHAREVNLEHGEASFDVTPEAERPFSVRAGRREFQALGTRFNVRLLSPENIELTVTEGEVKVLYAPPRWPETPAKRRENLTFGETTLNALQIALVEPGYQSVRPLVPAEMQARLAWQRGMIIFDGERLEDVLVEMDRYTEAKFVLADNALSAVRIGGNFRTGDVDGLLRTLRDRFAIDSRRDAQGRIILSALQKI